jgi:hypothetical protein
MVLIKHMARPINDRVQPKLKDMASKHAAETLSQQREDSAEAASSQSRDNSPTDSGDNGSESQSRDSRYTSSESDSLRHVKVAVAAIAARIPLSPTSLMWGGCTLWL